MKPTFITDREICADLKRTSTTLWRWRRDGHFPQSVQIGTAPNSRATPLAAYEDWKARVMAGKVGGAAQ